MENLNFGWQFGVIMLLIFGVVYFFIAIINYILVVSLGGQVKKITDKTIIGKKENIFSTSLPFMIASIIIYLTVIQLSFIFIYPKTQYTAIGGPLFWEPYSFYLNGGSFGFIVGQTCLALTRYSFTKKWGTIGRLKNGRTIFNFFLWTILNIIVIAINKSVSKSFWFFYFFAYLSYIIFIIFTTFLFLKWRCVNKMTQP